MIILHLYESRCCLEFYIINCWILHNNYYFCISWPLGCNFLYYTASLVAKTVKNLPAMQETQVQILGQEDFLEKGMATHSRILAWRIPWTEEPGGLHSMGSHRVRHDWATNTDLPNPLEGGLTEFHFKESKSSPLGLEMRGLGGQDESYYSDLRWAGPERTKTTWSVVTSAQSTETVRGWTEF